MHAQMGKSENNVMQTRSQAEKALKWLLKLFYSCFGRGMYKLSEDFRVDIIGDWLYMMVQSIAECLDEGMLSFFTVC